MWSTAMNLGGCLKLQLLCCFKENVGKTETLKAPSILPLYCWMLAAPLLLTLLVAYEKQLYFEVLIIPDSKYSIFFEIAYLLQEQHSYHPSWGLIENRRTDGLKYCFMAYHKQSWENIPYQASKFQSRLERQEDSVVHKHVRVSFFIKFPQPFIFSLHSDFTFSAVTPCLSHLYISARNF